MSETDVPSRIIMMSTPEVNRYAYGLEKEREAQTALIAELVDAIEGLTSDRMNGPDSYELWHKATAVLSKAKLATTAEKSV